jgi:hypothetical protein
VSETEYEDLDIETVAWRCDCCDVFVTEYQYQKYKSSLASISHSSHG